MTVFCTAFERQMKKAILYQPVVVKKEYNNEHWYWVDDIFKPAVTKILGETMPMPDALKNWLGDIGTERAQQKLEWEGERGTLIHEACAKLIKEGKINLIEDFPDKKDKKVLTGFVNWFADYQPQPLEGYDKTEDKIFPPEFIVASKKGYAGTIDYVCRIKNKPYIIDFKTSKGIYENHKLQVVAYRQAFYENTGIYCKIALLHLTPLAKLGYSFYDTDRIKIKGKKVTATDFLAVLNLYKRLNGGIIPQPPLEEQYPPILYLKKQEQVI